MATATIVRIVVLKKSLSISYSDNPEKAYNKYNLKKLVINHYQ